MNTPPKYEDVVAQLDAALTREAAERLRGDVAVADCNDAERREAALQTSLDAVAFNLDKTDKLALALREELTTAKRAVPHTAGGGISQRDFDYDRGFSAGSAEVETFRMERDALQQRLTVAEQRNASITWKVSSCKDCGSSDLFWFAQNTVSNGIQQNRLNTHDIECVFFLGCNHCSATLKQISADTIAEKITAALKPAAEVASNG